MSILSDEKEFTVERERYNVHYWRSGDPKSPMIFLFHGAAVDHKQFDQQFPCLIEHYQVIRMDMAGHGKSRPINGKFRIDNVAEDIKYILDWLGVDDAIFIGQSAGTYAIQELAFIYPEIVRAMLLIDGTCITSKLSYTESISLRSTPFLFRIWPYTNLKRSMVYGSAIKPDTRKYLENSFNKLSKSEFINIWDGISSCVHYEPNYRIKCPLLLVYGEQDDLGNIKNSMIEWSTRELNAELIVIPDAGHSSNQDNPEFFNRVMVTFLKEIN